MSKCLSLDNAESFMKEFRSTFDYCCEVLGCDFSGYTYVFLSKSDGTYLEASDKTGKVVYKDDVTDYIDGYTSGMGKISAECMFTNLFLRHMGFYKDSFRAKVEQNRNGGYCIELGASTHGAEYIHKIFHTFSKRKDIIDSVDFGFGYARQHLYFTKVCDVLRVLGQEGGKLKAQTVSKLCDFKDKMLVAVQKAFADANVDLPSGGLKFCQMSDTRGKIVAKIKGNKKECSHHLGITQEDPSAAAKCFVVDFVLYQCGLRELFRPAYHKKDNGHIGLELILATHDENVISFWTNILDKTCKVSTSWDGDTCFRGWKNVNELCKTIKEKIHPISILC